MNGQDELEVLEYGSFNNLEMKKSDLLLIIVPPQPARALARIFATSFGFHYVEHAASKLLVAEQSEGNLFNRGYLLNTAYNVINTWNVRPRRVVFRRRSNSM